MCDACYEMDYETDEWVGVACGCPCTDGDMDHKESGIVMCSECNHKIG